MEALDVSGLERVGGTSAGSYYLIASDVLLAWPNEGYVQTVDGARDSLQEQYRIAEERGRRHVVIVAVDRVQAQGAGSRRVWSREADPEIMCGLVLVGKTALTRAIASFFLGLTKPRVPTIMVSTIEEALSWAESQLRDRGGEI